MTTAHQHQSIGSANWLLLPDEVLTAPVRFDFHSRLLQYSPAKETSRPRTPKRAQPFIVCHICKRPFEGRAGFLILDLPSNRHCTPHSLSGLLPFTSRTLVALPRRIQRCFCVWPRKKSKAANHPQYVCCKKITNPHTHNPLPLS